MFTSIERPTETPPAPGKILSDFGPVYASSGFIGWLFAVTAPVAIILAVGSAGGLSEGQIASWIFGVFFFNGLITILFCRHYQQPLAFFWTIPGTVLVGQSLTHLTFPEVVGAYYATAVLMLVLGATGSVKRAMELVPLPIVMGMVAGVFMKFGVDLVLALRDDLALAAPMVLVFVLLSAVPTLGRRMPPLIGAMIVGALLIAAYGTFDPAGAAGDALVRPNLYAPEFSWQAMLELVVPLAVTVLVVQNGQGFAVLDAVGHKAPINAVTIGCGAWSMITAMVGSVSTCLTGPTNALISSSGERHRHYTGGVLVGVLAIAFGLAAPFFTRLMLASPKAFIATIAGLAMLRVLQTAFVTAFGGGRFTLGALVTFVVTVADIAILNVGAAFWGLVAGCLVSWLLERPDFGTLGKA